MAIKIEESSGNVFRDLGFSARDAANLRLRAELMVELSRISKQRKMTQPAAAKLLGVSQTRVSDLMRGKIDLFSIDSLVDRLARADVGVELTIQPRRRAQRRRAA